MDALLRTAYPALLTRQQPQSPTPPDQNADVLLDSPGKKIGTALAIIIGVILIVVASYFCCCRHCCCHSRKPPISYQNKDLERAEAYEMQPPPPAVLPIYTGNGMGGHGHGGVELGTHGVGMRNVGEDEIQADGRVPADQMFGVQGAGKDGHAEVHDPPPEYPGSPVQRPAELMGRRI